MQAQGGIDPTYIAELLKTDPDSALAKLKGLVFKTPDGGYELKEQYLSGNVRKKLRAAREAAKADPAFAENVEALQEVIPKDLGPGEITAIPGAVWIPGETYGEFADQVLGVQDIRVNRLGGEHGGWSFDKARGTNLGNAANSDEFGMSKWDGVDILERIMNSQDMTVRQTDSDGKTFVNEELSALAKQKAEKIRGKFQEWVWKDSARTDRLSGAYNETFRSHVETEFPEWVTSLAGMSETWKGKIRDYQKAGAARIALKGNTLLGYVVGAGKTLTAAAGIMEARRLGVWKKPVVVAPNHLVAQWGSEILQYYPGAKVLVASKDDFTPQRRQTLFNRISTGNWDAVIVPQSSFKLMPVSPDYIRQYKAEALTDLEDAIEQERKDGDKKSATLKELEKQKDQFEARMDKMLNQAEKDSGPYFDELGIDSLVVDEAHDFKNLFFRTRNSRVPGINNQGNQKTFDMLMKTDWLNNLTDNRSVVFATGTPIANSMAEAWVMQRYLQPGLLKQSGAFAFDDWKSVFGEVVQLTRVDPIGRKFRIEERFNRFVNLPELRRLWAQTADIKVAKDLDLPRPPLSGGKPSVEKVDSGPMVKDYMMGLAARAGDMPQDPSEDNILVVMNEGLKVAVDMRLLEPDSKPLENTKLKRVSSNVYDVWKKTTPFRGTQIVWLDVGVPKKPKKLTQDMVAAGEYLLEALKDGPVSIDKLRTEWDSISRRKDKAKQFKNWLVQIDQDVRWQDAAEGDDGAFNIGGKEGDENNPPQWVAGIETADPEVTSQSPPPWNAYQEVKDQLVAKGVPAAEIGFIHDFDTQAKQAKAYADMRSGKLRVMLASTRKMGTGANVQQRLVANHHVDAPWRAGGPGAARRPNPATRQRIHQAGQGNRGRPGWRDHQAVHHRRHDRRQVLADTRR